MVGRFAEMCRRRGLMAVQVMVLNGDEGLECEVRLKHVSEFKYLGCVLDKSGTDGAEYRRGG